MRRVVVIAALFVLGLPAGGLIKADFTPVHLVNQSTLIVELSFGPVTGGRATATVKRVMKGKLDAPKLFFDLTTAAAKEHAAELEKNLKAHGDATVILFASEPRDDAAADTPPADAPAKPGPMKAYLHVDNQWTAFYAGKANLWQLEGVDSAMAGTWQGGTDMLIRAVDYVQADANADLPAVEGVNWAADGAKPFAKLTGTVTAAYPVDLNRDGARLLFVECEGGDRLFQLDATTKEMTDVTAAHAGAAKAIRAARAGVPELPAPADKALGELRASIVADFDNDGLPDVLRVFEGGGLAHKGTAPGRFAPPRPCKIAAPGGPRAGAFVGDFDGDGLLDVFVTGADRCVVWQNRGQFDFESTLPLTGELAYKGNADVAFGQACDFNGDGRPDLALFYAGTFPSLFFNRGFRSFGFSNGLDLDKGGQAPALKAGQRAGCVADLDGDGADELIAITTAGECWVLPLESGGEGARGVRVALPKGQAGPVTVVAWQGKRCLGARNVTGVSDVRISTRDAGPITVKWKTPAGVAREQVVTPAAKAPARVVLGG